MSNEIYEGDTIFYRIIITTPDPDVPWANKRAWNNANAYAGRLYRSKRGANQVYNSIRKYANLMHEDHGEAEVKVKLQTTTLSWSPWTEVKNE